MRRAFTLIELLVVIAIIAILAAILFPVFAQAKEAAKGAAAVSNIKQMGTATALYMGDTDDVYPLAAYGSDTAFVIWHDILDPYVKNKDVWLCPGSQISPTDANGQRTSHWGYNVRYITTLGLDFGNANGHVAVSASGVGAPAETVLFTSARTSVAGSWCGDEGKFLLPPSEANADCWGRPDFVRAKNAIVLCADMHANQRQSGVFYSGQSPVDKFFDLSE